jgi:hypothetical protein
MQFILSKNNNRHSILSTAFYIMLGNFTAQIKNQNQDFFEFELP